MKNSFGSRVFDVFNYTFFVILSLLMIYPLWYVIMYSFSDPNVVVLNGLYLTPSKFSLSTYKFILGQHTIFTGIMNSIFITVIGTALSLFLLSFSAYPLSRDKFVGRKFVFAYFIFTMLFNGGMVPTYLVVRQFGMVNSLWSLIIPNSLSIYYMLIMIKFFKTIPLSVFESAKLDGAKEFYIVFKIVLPLSKAALAAIGLFCAVGQWNQYFSGLIYLNDMEKYPLQVILYGMLTRTMSTAATGNKGLSVTPMNIKMGAVVVTLLPILLVYPFVQKYFMTGVMLGSVKG